MRPAARRLDWLMPPVPDEAVVPVELELELELEALVLPVLGRGRASGFRRIGVTGAAGRGAAVGAGARTGISGISGSGVNSVRSGNSGGAGGDSGVAVASDGTFSTGLGSPRLKSSSKRRVSVGSTATGGSTLSGANTATLPNPATLSQVASVPMLRMWDRPCMERGREPKWVRPV